MSFNAARAYLETKDKYIDFLLDRAVNGAFPNDGEEDFWRRVRRQVKANWLSGDPAKSIFGRPIIESLAPYHSIDESIDDLVRNGVLHPDMPHFLTPELRNGEHHLFTHQLESLRQSR